MRPGAHFVHEPTRYQLDEAGPRSTRGESDGFGDLAGAVFPAALQQSEYRLVPGVDGIPRRGAERPDSFNRGAVATLDCRMDRQPEADANLLPEGGARPASRTAAIGTFQCSVRLT